VSGFAWYFAQQQISNFNSQQSELIRRVEQNETAENCITYSTQSRKTLTIVILPVGIARR